MLGTPPSFDPESWDPSDSWTDAQDLIFQMIVDCVLKSLASSGLDTIVLETASGKVIPLWAECLGVPISLEDRGSQKAISSHR